MNEQLYLASFYPGFCKLKKAANLRAAFLTKY